MLLKEYPGLQLVQSNDELHERQLVIQLTHFS